MRAAEEAAADFHSMANDPASAVLANRGHGLNGALETVECVPRAGSNHFKTLVVVISTDFTNCHSASFELPGKRLDVRSRQTVVQGGCCENSTPTALPNRRTGRLMGAPVASVGIF